MIKILGRPSSSNVQKALWCCAELGVEFEHEPEYGGAFGRTDTPEYRALNPTGLVPTMLHDDTVLWESHVIVRYLAATFGMGGLCPADAKTRARSDQWMEWAHTTLEGTYFPAFFELIRKSEAERSVEKIQGAVAAGSKQLAILEPVMGEHPFLVSDQLTMGDIVFGPTIHRWYNLDIECPDTPNVEGWYRRMLDRPGFAKYVAVELT